MLETAQHEDHNREIKSRHLAGYGLAREGHPDSQTYHHIADDATEYRVSKGQRHLACRYGHNYIQKPLVQQ